MALNAESGKMRADKSAPRTIVLDENGCVDIKLLKSHPLNEELYPFSQHYHTIELLGLQMEVEYKKFGIPNHTAVDFCPVTGIINSGHFRYYSAKKHGWTKLKGALGRPYDPNYEKYDEIKFLEKFNKDGKRDEYEHATLVHNFNVQNQAFFAKYGRELNAQERNQFAIESRIDKEKFRKLVILSNEHPDLFKRYLAGNYTIGKAWRLSGKQKAQKKYNTDRYDFFAALDRLPAIQENMTSKGLELIQQFRNFGDGIIFDDKMGWETNQITQPLSNIWMSSAVYGFNSVLDKSLDCETPRKRQGYADIHFPILTDMFSDEFQTERIEVKVGAWNDNASSTKIYGGMGSVNVTPHEYIIGIHNQELKKHFLMITTLDKDDWKTDGKDSNATMTLSSWFNRYYDTDKYRILLGDIFKGNKSIEINWA